MIKFKNKDLIEAFKNSEYDAIIHQTNCTIGMGGGIARIIGNEFPETKERDKEMREEIDDINFLNGNYVIIPTIYGDVINCYSQFSAGPPSKEGIDTFENRKQVLSNVLYQVAERGYFKVGIPLIASGLARVNYDSQSDIEYFVREIFNIVSDMDKINPQIQIEICYL